jgi:hypothetical protein
VGKIRAVFVMVGLVFLGITPLHAAGESDFDKGVNLFNQSKYRAALAHFIAAKDAGMQEPKLYFNMGVSYYRLEQYGQAKEAFLHAAEHSPMRDLAYYNIGLVESARNQSAQANIWFQRVYDKTGDANLKELAAAKLGLKPGQEYSSSGHKWFGGFSTAVGYDDNIEDPSQNGVTGKGDNFINVMLYGIGVVQGSYDNGIRLAVNGYFQHYQDVTIYDLNMLQANLDKSFTVGSWQNVAGFGVEQTTLGTKDYLRTVKLKFSGEKMLSSTDKLRLRYRYSDIASLDTAYDKLKGSRHEAEVRWQRQLSDKRIRASYEYEVNDRNDFRNGTTFLSYSPTRHTVELWARMRPTPAWMLKGRLAYRHSIYSDANILASGRRVTREDDRSLLALGMSHKLGKSLKFNLDYKYTDNTSNISGYDYTRNIYSAALTGGF